MIETFKVLFTYEQDSETGEIKCINREVISDEKVSKKVSKKKTNVSESSLPQIILEDNKYTLNSAAVELMGVNPDDRLDIKYEKSGKMMIPVIGTNESFGTKAGNRLTKSFTVSYRGKANEELHTYGTVFNISPHTSKSGIFIMQGDVVQPIIEDDKVEIKDEDIDVDLSDFIEADEDEVEEITSLDFNLNF